MPTIPRPTNQRILFWVRRWEDGSHRATAQWTRHATRLDSNLSICGLAVRGRTTVDGEPGQRPQGQVRDCQRCRKMTAAHIWEG